MALQDTFDAYYCESCSGEYDSLVGTTISLLRNSPTLWDAIKAGYRKQILSSVYNGEFDEWIRTQSESALDLSCMDWGASKDEWGWYSPDAARFALSVRFCGLPLVGEIRRKSLAIVDSTEYVEEGALHVCFRMRGNASAYQQKGVIDSLEEEGFKVESEWLGEEFGNEIDVEGKLQFNHT